MGCSNSKARVPEGDSGHPELYYKGTHAVKEGRYSVSELYFQQAIQNHPGRAWWAELLEAVTEDGKKKEDAHDKTSLQVPDDLDRVAAGNNDMKKSIAIPGSGTESDEAAGGKQKAIELPLDRRLNDIIDFIRMISDIAHAYFSTRSSTTKPRYIGALYCGTICVHMQIFSHLLTMLREEQTAEIRERMNDPTIPSFKTYIWMKAYGKSTSDEKSSKSKKQREQELASDESLLLTLELLETALRYYWLSAVVNYIVIIFRITQTLSPTNKEEAKKRNVIFTNIFENCTLGEDCIMGVLRSFGHHYLGEAAKVYFEIPEEDLRELQFVKYDANAAADDAASQQRSSQQDRRSARYYTSLLSKQSAGGSAGRSLITMSREFSATVPNTLTLPNVLPVRFVLQKQVLRKHRARIQSPAERYSLYYVSWVLSLNYDFIPGHSDFFDAHTGPDRHFTDADYELSKEAPPEMLPAVTTGTVMAIDKGDGAANADAATASATGSGGAAARASCDERPTASQAFPDFHYQPFVNEKIDLGSLHKACLLGFEENIYMMKIIYCLKMHMYELQGENVTAGMRRRANFNYFLGACFGTQSFERVLCDQLTREMGAIYSDD